MKKPSWVRPELVVLLKGQAQEAVLTLCKSPKNNGLPESGTTGQTCGNPKENSCQACQSRPGTS